MRVSSTPFLQSNITNTTKEEEEREEKFQIKMFKTRSILNYNHLPLKRCKKDVYTFDHHTNNSKLCIIYGKEMKEI